MRHRGHENEGSNHHLNKLMIIKQILPVSVVGNIEKNMHTDSTVANKPSHPLVLDLFPVSKPRGESKTVTL